jgi:hypothetical protein
MTLIRFRCDACHRAWEHTGGATGAGFAVVDGNKRLCYTCSGLQEATNMAADGHTTMYRVVGGVHFPASPAQVEVAKLYPEFSGYWAINWTGTIRFPIASIRQRQSILGWFWGPDNKVWGVTRSTSMGELIFVARYNLIEAPQISAMRGQRLPENWYVLPYRYHREVT